MFASLVYWRDSGPRRRRITHEHDGRDRNPRSSAEQAEVTPEELLAMPDGGHYELIDGELRDAR